MTADDFNRCVMERLERQPFQAFTIELLDGSRLEIDREFSVSIRGGLATCFVRGRLHPSVRSEQVRQVIDAPLGAVVS